MTYLEILKDNWKKHLSSKEENSPTVISTFAGCGGSSLGYSIAGFKELLAIEWEENAAKTFKYNFPEVKFYHGDICKITIEEVFKLTNLRQGELDVFDGSPPCQGFSTAGSREFSDNRNQLFKEFTRLLKGLMPKVFVMENVTGMIKGKMKLIFVEILNELKSCGYNVSAKVLNAKYYNVPQSRERLIFIGVRSDLSINSSHPISTGKIIFTIKDAIANLPSFQVEEIEHTWIDESPQGRNTKTYKLALKAKQGEKYSQQQIRCDFNKPSPTITKGGIVGSLYLRNILCHPIYTRSFSHRELARMQSFPDEFKFFDNKGFERIGNSVPPLLMAAIAQHIKDNILSKIK